MYVNMACFQVNNSNMNNQVKCLSKRGKRFRSAFTTEQVNYLETEFKKYPYIGNARRKDVANVLNIPERAVKIWFQNRRMKEKKDGTNKDMDETKNLELCGDQLRNLSVLTINKSHSLPVLNTLKEIPNKTTSDNSIVMNDAKLDLSVPRCVQSNSNFYKDITPERELTNVNISPGPIKNKCSISRTSANFSIELLKKYKSEFSKQEVLKENEVDLSQEIRHSPSNGLKKHKPSISQFPVTAMPQDLSSYKKPTTVPFEQQKVISEQPLPNNLETSMNNADLPLYVKGFYAQPYIPPGNMIWKPVNVAPVMSTGFSALNLSNNTPLNMTIGQQNIPKSCNCDCHMKPYCSPILYQQANPNPQVQYVITAVPLQNSVPKF